MCSAEQLSTTQHNTAKLEAEPQGSPKPFKAQQNKKHKILIIKNKIIIKNKKKKVSKSKGIFKKEK
jgi:hypothetical protein